MKKINLLAVGNANVDIFLTIHQSNKYCRLNKKESELCVAYGQKILVDQGEFLLGGGAANVAVGLSRLGFSSSLIAEIGDDELSQKILNSLLKENIDSSNLIKTKGEASSFSIGINFQAERTLLVRHVERSHNFSFNNVQADWVYLGGLGKEWKRAYQNTLNFVQSSGCKLAFAPGTTQIEAGYSAIADVLKVADILFLNKEEATKVLSIMYKVSSIDELLKTLKNTGSKVVVITDGENGSFVIDEKEEVFSLGAIQSQVIEKTGAGDAFAAGFLAAIILGLTINEAMSWGTVNAGAVIGKVGAQTGLLTKEEIERKK